MAALRLLHTSDWHLGQHFMGKSRQAEHQALCQWLLEQVQALQVDVVLIAGDLFDTGTPPSYAREQYNQLVLALRRVGCGLVLLGGNHDSPAMLGESRQLLAELGAQVLPCLASDPDEQLLTLRNRQGEVAGLLCAIPFLRARDLLRSEAGHSATSKQQDLQQAIAAHYQQLFALAEARRAELGLALPIIASGHLTTVGASSSESVREIYVGSLEAFPSNAFPPADYIALGHIHRPQQVGGQAHIRYSGSPLPLSFDEAVQTKQMLLVDFAEGRLQAIEELPVPRWQGLASVRGSLAELPARLAELAATASASQPLWLEVQVQDDAALSDLHGRVASLCADLPLEVLRIRRERSQPSLALHSAAGESLDELSAEEVFARRLQEESFDPPTRESLLQLYRQVLAEVRDNPEADSAVR